jgi:hypothetical protein
LRFVVPSRPCGVVKNPVEFGGLDWEFEFVNVIACSALDRPVSRVIWCHRKSGVTEHHGSSALADILVQCPRTGAPVPTGLKTEWVLLRSLPCVAVPLRCPACGQIHKWKPDDAWIGSARPPSDAGLLNASRAPLLAATTGNGAKTPE